MPIHKFVFISYARKDGRDLAMRVQRDLDERGHTAWLDTQRIAGGASWTQQIENAIDECDVGIALLSTGSYLSDICRAEQLRTLRCGKTIVPLLVHLDADRPLHLEHLNYLDFSDPARYRETFEALADQVQTGRPASLPARWRQTAVTVPALPIHFTARPEKLAELRRATIGDGEEPRVTLTALCGMGGTGKTVLAQALSGDEAIQAAFPDGVIWVEIGPAPGSLVDQMREIGKVLGDSPEHYDTPTASATRLRTLLQDLAVLLVLDNVWNAEHVETFRVDVPRCGIVFTTRDSEIALSLGATEVRLGTFTREESVTYLSRAARRDEPQASLIAEQLGDHPLALKLAGARLAEGMNAEKWLETFHHVSQMRLGRRSRDPQENLEVCFDLSVERLKREGYDDRPFFYALGVFPQGKAIPVQPIDRLWSKIDPNLTAFDCGEIRIQLRRAALIEGEDEGYVALHDLLHDYAAGKLGTQLAATHLQLLNAYNPDAAPWPAIENDDYLYRQLAFHLCQARRIDELRDLLFDYSWLEAKLSGTDVNSLVDDYDFINDPAAVAVQRTLRRAAHVLALDPKQLAAQLLGRLHQPRGDHLARLCAGAAKGPVGPWLRPLTTSLRQSDSLVYTLAGHRYSVEDIAVTADGTKAVSASLDNTLKLWDLTRGRELLTLRGHQGPVQAVLVTEDGRQAISGSEDSTIKVWSLETGAELRTLEGHRDAVTALALAPDRNVISVSKDGTIRTWDLDRATEIRCRKNAHGTSWLLAVTVTSDGGQIISGGLDNLVKLWDAATLEPLASLAGHSDSVTDVALSANGQRLVTASDDGLVAVWHLERREPLCVLQGHEDFVSAVTISPDGSKVASGSRDKTVRIWDLESGEPLGTLGSHADWVRSLVWAPDGRRIFSGAADRALKVWECSAEDQGSPLHDHSDEISVVAVTPDGRFAVSGSGDSSVKIWDIETGGELRTLQGHSDSVKALAVTPDGQRIISGSMDQTIKIWDLKSGREQCSLMAHSWIMALAVTPDGRRVVSGGFDGIIRVWDLLSGEVLRAIETGEMTMAIAMTADGRRIVSESAGQKLRVSDVETGEEILSMAIPRGAIFGIVLGPDEREAYSVSSGGRMTAWDLKTGAELWNLEEAHVESANGIALLPDGQHALTCSDDKTVKMWDLEARKCLASLRGASAFLDCATTPDGRVAIAGDAGGRLHFLRIEGLPSGKGT